MADFLVLVNGLPGSGKTTLARQLSAALSAPLISKDEIKEGLEQELKDGLEKGLEQEREQESTTGLEQEFKDGLTEVSPERAGVVASERMWDLAAATPGLVVLESWWFRPRDLGFVERGRARCGNPRTVEIWCVVPPEVALARYRARRRAAVHQDAVKLAAHWDAWVEGAEPLGVAYVIGVGTDGPVDVAGLAERVSAMAGLRE